MKVKGVIKQRVLGFFDDRRYSFTKSGAVPAAEFYHDFVDWQETKGYPVLSQRMFKKQLRKMGEVTEIQVDIDGKNRKVYSGISAQRQMLLAG